MEGILEETMLVDATQYCIYGYSGYSSRAYLGIPFQVSVVKSDQFAFNQAVSSARTTVEWMFKEMKSYWAMVDLTRKMSVIQLGMGTVR